MTVALFPEALPDFPWDVLEPFRSRAASHPDGAIYLAVGTPVDPTLLAIRAALAAASDAPGAFYGYMDEHQVRIALTARDDRIEAAASRLTGLR